MSHRKLRILVKVQMRTDNTVCDARFETKPINIIDDDVFGIIVPLGEGFQ
jgi:hypothetical protein